jgi:hypothetical protein
MSLDEFYEQETKENWFAILANVGSEKGDQNHRDYKSPGNEVVEIINNTRGGIEDKIWERN